MEGSAPVSTEPQHPLVTRYLKDLNRALRDLPATDRDQVIKETAARLGDAAAARGNTMTEAELRTVLNELGHPQMIAEQARERLGIRRRSGGAMEGIAIASLLVGGLIVPVLGWLLGVVLLWASSAWNTRDKILGTLVVPGGLAAPLYLGIVAVGASSCIDGPGCTGESEVVFPGAAMILIGVLVLASISMAIYLGRKAFRNG